MTSTFWSCLYFHCCWWL